MKIVITILLLFAYTHCNSQAFCKVEDNRGDTFDVKILNAYGLSFFHDTAIAFAPYHALISSKLNITDTGSMLSNYSSAINARIKVSDTSFMLSAYGTAIGLRIKYTDTASMLSGYTTAINLRLKSSDTTSLSNRINTKQSIITPGTTGQYLRGDLTLATFPSSNLNLFDKTGSLSTTVRAFTDTFSISTSTPTISLSGYLSTMACSNFKLISVTGFRTGASTSTSPTIAVTAVSSNSVSLIANQINTATTTILGISVLSGLPTILVPDPTNIKIVLSFLAW